MQKTQAVLELVVKNNTYRFECSPDSPLAEVNEALSQMKAFIVGRIKEAEEASKVKENG